MLNKKLYQHAKGVFHDVSPSLFSSYSEQFVAGIQSHCDCDETSYNIERHGDGDVFTFEGYPSGNFLKQVSTPR